MKHLTLAWGIYDTETRKQAVSLDFYPGAELRLEVPEKKITYFLNFVVSKEI